MIDKYWMKSMKMRLGTYQRYSLEAEWQQVYNKANIREGEFTAVDGDKEQVEFIPEENIT